MDVATSPAPAPFGEVLRRYRLAAGLSQEDLAERARLSVSAISALERGLNRAPNRNTFARLADALGLTDDERAVLAAAVSRGRRLAAAPTPTAQLAPSPSPNNLPVPATTFVGRAQEQTTLVRLLETARLLTLTGTGGVGKTRLATHVAATLSTAAAYPDGVWLVELAAVADAAPIPQAAMQALGLREQPGTPLLDTLTAALREQTLLLLLDNCEHLLPEAGAFAETLLRAGPGVHILATSREALGALGETVWWVPSLAVPADPARSGPETRPASATQGSGLRTEDSDAARLFVERATAAHPAFTLTAATAPAVATICRRLDGIPLALELAAARTRILTPEQIAARLDERFRLLTGGNSAVPRHETLRATLDWSYELLNEPEQRLLAHLAVFAGGCDLEAAEAVCTDDALPPGSLVALLTDLVEKSLVTVDYRGEAARYRQLETVRQYAAEHLEAAGETDVVRRRHRDWAIDLARRASPLLHGPQQAIWLERLDTEHDNVRAALNWSLTIGDATSALRLATSLEPLWSVRAHFDEGRAWFARALACPGDSPPAVRARALGRAAELAYRAGDPDAAAELAQEELVIWRELGDRRGMGAALRQLGDAAWERRDIARARVAWEESLALMREARDQGGVADALRSLALLAQFAGDLPRAVDLCEQSITIYRELGNKRWVANSLRLIGTLFLDLGAYPPARACAEEGLPICEELGERWQTAGMLRLLGHVAVGEGDLPQAVTLHEQSLARHRELGNTWTIAEGLYYLARTLLKLGDPTRAEALLQESLTLCHELRYQSLLPGVLRALGDTARMRGDVHRATAYLSRSLEESRALNEPREIAPTLERLAATTAAGGQPDRATRLLAAAAALRDTTGPPFRPHADMPTDILVTTLHTTLGDPAFAAAWAEGAAMSPDEAIAYARANTGTYPTPLS